MSMTSTARDNRSRPERSGEVWISACDVGKVYRSHRAKPVVALSDVRFAAPRGSFVSIVGPSGCGKTTLLKIFAGLVETSYGDVAVAGQPVKGPSPNIGMVFQTATLLKWRTILQNVLLPIELQGRSKQQYRARANELLDMVGLAGYEHRLPRELSGGMQQRAGICRALIHEPDVLLMDEPFGALDALTRENMAVELQRIWQASQQTIVFVTHSISEAVFLSDLVIVMTSRPGRIADVVEIDLPRTRQLDVMNTTEAGHYVSRIRQHFNNAATE